VNDSKQNGSIWGWPRKIIRDGIYDPHGLYHQLISWFLPRNFKVPSNKLTFAVYFLSLALFPSRFGYLRQGNETSRARYSLFHLAQLQPEERTQEVF
jgi:hypothetical protein